MEKREKNCVVTAPARLGVLVSECWIRIRLSMCVPQIENVIKRRRNLNESDKVSSNIWVPNEAASRRKNQRMCSIMMQVRKQWNKRVQCEFENAGEECNGTRLLRRVGEV